MQNLRFNVVAKAGILRHATLKYAPMNRRFGLAKKVYFFVNSIFYLLSAGFEKN